MPRTTATERYLSHSVEGGPREQGYSREVDSLQEAMMRRQSNTLDAKIAPAVGQTDVPKEAGTFLDQYYARNAEKEQHLQRTQLQNADLFNELDRRRNGMTPLNSLDAPTNAPGGLVNTNFAQGREHRRQEEQKWRTEAARDEGTFGGLRSFASNKWNALAHGSNKDQVQTQRTTFGRERQNDNDWKRGPTAAKDNGMKENAVQNTVEPVKANGGWRFPFISGELHHMAPGWTGKENTRFIDTLTDDELSMMSL